MPDVTYAQAVMVERAANDPQPVSGTDLGNGQVAMHVVPYADNGSGTPVALKVSDFGGLGTTIVEVEVITVLEPSEATRQKFLTD